MSCNAWMEYTLEVLDDDYEVPIVENLGLCATKGRRRGGPLVLKLEWESAGWFFDAVENLKTELSTIPAPPDKWEAHVHYEYLDDGPSADGAIVEFDVIDGAVANFKESRVTMVACEPWATFDLKEE